MADQEPSDEKQLEIAPPSQKKHIEKIIVPQSQQNKKDPKDTNDTIKAADKNNDSEILNSFDDTKQALDDSESAHQEPSLENLPQFNDNNADTEDAQQPRIYDTKKYHVPINDTNHKHGFLLGTIVAGVLTAIIVLGVLMLIAKS